MLSPQSPWNPLCTAIFPRLSTTLLPELGRAQWLRRTCTRISPSDPAFLFSHGANFNHNSQPTDILSGCSSQHMRSMCRTLVCIFFSDPAVFVLLSVPLNALSVTVHSCGERPRWSENRSAAQFCQQRQKAQHLSTTLAC